VCVYVFVCVYVCVFVSVYVFVSVFVSLCFDAGTPIVAEYSDDGSKWCGGTVVAWRYWLWWWWC
jgi:hypothetical protein